MGVQSAVVMVAVCLGCLRTAGAADEGKTKKGDAAARDAEVKEALATVEKVLKGGKASDLDLKNLDGAVIKLEAASPAGGMQSDRGVEAGAPGLQKNIYILRFDAGGGGEQQLQLLRLQREILKNQLVLMKTMSTIANYQVMLGTRTARVESTMRDMTLGMKSSATEMHKVRGDTAGTNAKVTDIASTTTDMAEEVKEISKNIDDVESSIESVDVMIGKVSDKMDSQSDDMERGFKKLGDSPSEKSRD